MRVSVVQMHCKDDGDKEANMQTFRKLVEEACTSSKPHADANNDTAHSHHKKPELLLGPECAFCGYTYDYDVAWKSAEPQGGPTEQLLCELAAQYQVYVGVTYLEAREIINNDDGKDAGQQQQQDKNAHFLNTFALAGPNGTIEGRVSKARPCSVEAYLFRGPAQVSHIIECSSSSGDDGAKILTSYRFGVLICYENMDYDALHELHAGPPLDLLLMPFSGPLVDGTRPHMRHELGKLYDRAGPRNARLLACPALYCNKVGDWSSIPPTSFIPASMFCPTNFPGRSSICNARGDVRGHLNGTQQTVLTVDVVLGRDATAAAAATDDDNKNVMISQRPSQVPRYWGGYVDSATLLKFSMIFEWFGARSYQQDVKRQRMARQILDQQQQCQKYIER